MPATAGTSKDLPMDVHPRDDFSAFTGYEHMFVRVAEPYALIRSEVEAGFRRQVADSVVEVIQTIGSAKFLAVGRPDVDPQDIAVRHYAFCVRAIVTVSYAAGSRREEVPTSITFLFGNVERAGEENVRTHFDVNRDAARGFEDDVFEERFMTFCRSLE
ncbi:MAG: hypothetical protein F9K40_14120 [Kofleriaceae bacterium]|nr:MAG: hypothetical protein F9K40_14120 [Kofleriaceae bacterium]